MADYSLDALQKKVRRLARVSSSNIMTDAEINQNIDLAYQNRFPATLKLTSLRRTFTFFTEPNVDVYSTNTEDEDAPLYDFKNAILESSDPIYISGYPASFSQSRAEFFERWPLTQHQQQISTGNGVAFSFTGTLNPIPVLHEGVSITSIKSNGEGVGLTASPVLRSVFGNETQDGNFYNIQGPILTGETSVNVGNTINYTTGVYTITFPFIPRSGEPIYADTVPYAAGRPIATLWFNNSFTLRPVPDRVYSVTIECQVPPTALVNPGDVPHIKQWFEYIAMLAAQITCEDRNDAPTLAILMPSLENQEKLVERRTLRQQGHKRSATIYNSQARNNGRRRAWWQGW